MTRSVSITLLLTFLSVAYKAKGFVTTTKPAVQRSHSENVRSSSLEPLKDMKRPLLDRLATAAFNLENARVKSSSEIDEQGREGEPMEWSEKNSFANQFSEFMAGAGYGFKQFVADIVAGDFDEGPVVTVVDEFVDSNQVAMFSFTTCPFCRRAKDYLDGEGIPYVALELDEDDQGNEIRAVLGRKTKRTSMPAIFINGEFIGGCNDGPGLLTLANSGELQAMLDGSK